MAGFFGMGNHAKVGKGVDKRTVEKKRFFIFWELFFRKFLKLIQLNGLFILFSLPIITIGPAMAGMCKVLKYYATEKPVFLFSDFMDGFKSDFKQSILMNLFNIVFGGGAVFSAYFYRIYATDNALFYVAMVVSLIFLFFIIVMNFYTYLLIATVADMKFTVKLKNAFLLSVLGTKSNFFTLLFLGVLLLASWWYLPIGFILTIVGLFAWCQFIIVFNSYPVIDKYIIDPYYEQTGEQRPDQYTYDDFEDDIMIFEDMGTQEVQAKTSSSKGKVIK